jgi:hypothetical protein
MGLIVTGDRSGRAPGCDLFLSKIALLDVNGILNIFGIQFDKSLTCVTTIKTTFHHPPFPCFFVSPSLPPLLSSLSLGNL